MRFIDPKFDLNLFFSNLKKTSSSVLFLDYDGTLAPFCVERDKAFPYPGVCPILDQLLQSLRTRLVMVSGRQTSDLSPLLALHHPVEIWGSHGREHLFPDGCYELSPMDEQTLSFLVEANQFVEKAGLKRYTEQKVAALALHWRGLDRQTADNVQRQALEGLVPLAHTHGLLVQPFDGGLEIRLPGKDKGIVVGKVLSELPENAMAAYLGDDLTDEDAFLSLKGKGLGVLVRPEFRPTAANIWLEPPKELLNFLSRWAEATKAD